MRPTTVGYVPIWLVLVLLAFLGVGEMTLTRNHYQKLMDEALKRQELDFVARLSESEMARSRLQKDYDRKNENYQELFKKYDAVMRKTDPDYLKFPPIKTEFAK